MNEQQIRQIIRDEMNKKNFLSGSPFVPPHRQDGISNVKIDKQFLTGNKINTGSITFSSIKSYSIAVNFRPSSLWTYGNVVDGSGNIKGQFIGNALFGNAFYSSPSTSSSVNVASTIQNVAQSSSYFLVDNTGGSPAFHALAGQTHLIDIQYPVGTTHARMTVDSTTGKGIQLTVNNLDSGWNINANFVIL